MRHSQRRKNECSGDKRNIHDDKVNGLTDHLSRHIPGIRFFQQAHAGILTQCEIQLPVSGVDRNDPASVTLQQAIGKSAGGSADIETGFVPDIDRPVFESAFELKTAAADVLQIFAEQANLCVRNNLCAGFFEFLIVDQNFPRENESLCALA